MTQNNLDFTHTVLLKYLLKELTQPVSRHVTEYMKSNMESQKNGLLTALMTAATEPNLCDKQRTIVVELADHEAAANITQIPGADYQYFLTSTDEDFNKIFRMKRKTIKQITRILVKRRYGSVKEPYSDVPLKKKVLLTAWLLGNKETYSTAAIMFGLTHGAVLKIFHEICCELTALAGKYIQWPSPAECSHITKSFAETYGFPAIGVIGYHHVDVRLPDDYEEKDRFCRSGSDSPSIIVQAVVDNKLLIRDVCAGYSGSTSIVQAFVQCPLYPRLVDTEFPLMPAHQHLLGSSEYPQLASLLTPYALDADKAPVADNEAEFNCLHQSACLVVDEMFLLLKARFQRLNLIEVEQPEVATKVAVAACVLHNFAILHGDEFECAQ